MNTPPTCTPGRVTRGCTCTACDRLRDDRLTYRQKRAAAFKRIRARRTDSLNALSERLGLGKLPA